MSLSDQLAEFMDKLDKFSMENCPPFLTPNSYCMSVVPGHNLDVMQVSFDFKIDRLAVLMSKEKNFLVDPSKPELEIVK